MKEKKSIFDHLGSVLNIFGFSMIVMMIFCAIFGEDAKEISSIFRLGSRGLALETMLQYLLVAIVIEGLRTLFFSEKYFKNWSVAVRTAGMLCAILVIMAVVIISFDWFPVNMWQSWLAFFGCFGISFLVSIALMILKEKIENRQMEEGLKRLKKELEEKKDDKGL